MASYHLFKTKWDYHHKPLESNNLNGSEQENSIRARVPILSGNTSRVHALLC